MNYFLYKYLKLNIGYTLCYYIIELWSEKWYRSSISEVSNDTFLIGQVVQLDNLSDRYIINNLINRLTSSFNQVNNVK